VERTIHDERAWRGRCRMHDRIPLRKRCNGRERRDPELEISDVRSLDKFQRLQHLDKRDRVAVIILINGVLASRAVESAIASTR